MLQEDNREKYVALAPGRLQEKDGMRIKSSRCSDDHLDQNQSSGHFTITSTTFSKSWRRLKNCVVTFDVEHLTDTETNLARRGQAEKGVNFQLQPGYIGLSMVMVKTLNRIWTYLMECSLLIVVSDAEMEGGFVVVEGRDCLGLELLSNRIESNLAIVWFDSIR